MTNPKVVCIGEALIDRIIRKSDNKYKNYLGGAPANVACALSKLKISTAFIGCIGDDNYGHNFVNLFQNLNININFLDINKKYSTRVVKVVSDQYGDRSFSGFDNSSNNAFADEMLDIGFLKKNLLDLNKVFLSAKFLITGTILLASPESYESLLFLIKSATKYKVKIVIDLNWREIFWQNINNSKMIPSLEQKEKIKEFLCFADIIKLAKEEALLFLNSSDPVKISQSLPKLPDVIITDGAKPIFWFINGKSGSMEVNNSIKIVDTTGAGDAFLAGLISQLSECSSNLDSLQIKKMVKFASCCGLLACSGEGAIENQPDIESVNQLLGSLGS